MTSRKLAGLIFASAACLFAAGLPRAQAAVNRDKPAVEASVKKAVAAVNKSAGRKTHKKTAHKKTPARTMAAKAAAKSQRAPMPVVIVSKAANDAPNFDYQDRIQEAQELVARQPVLNNDMQFDDRGNLIHFVWTLAVGQRTGPLTILRMDETGKNDQGFEISWPVDNFLNTKFHVARPDGLIVFAQRRPVRVKDSYQEAVYTAYSPELDTKTMREAGMDYLRHLQRLAYERIKDHDVRSRVTPGITVADRIPTSMVVRLMITEHVDPLHMKYVGIEQCVHEVLFTIAANREHAYAYAKSSAGARGLPQFIDDSYQMVRANYPNALLEPDFERGMSDLRNAVLASVLLLDLELTQLPRDALARIADSGQQFAAFLAAGYNRNPAHVVQTYVRTHSFTGGNAPFQNKMYVRIQSWIGGFLKKEYGVS
ncbi:MAG TPA: hypothetical protein VFI23_07830 [Rhizomicrobium sp.]|nr:hypothetical protein [Rhizomicrobium sp.]